MKKRILIIGLAVAVLIASAGTGIWFYANAEAADQVRQAMVEADLAHRVTYEKVTYNPLTQKVVIHDIRPVGDAASRIGITADSLELIDWQKDEIVESIHFRLVNLRLNALEAARQDFSSSQRAFQISLTDNAFQILDWPAQALVTLGYFDVIAGGEVDYRYDPEENTLRLSINLQSAEMGRVDLNLAFAGVGPLLMEAIAEFLSQASSDLRTAAATGMRMRSDLQSELERISLANVQLSYEDLGLFRRLKQYNDVHTLRLPDEPSQFELSDEDIEQAVIVGTQFGVPSDTVKSSAEAVVKFTRKPDRLVFTTYIDQPIPLSRLAQAGEDANAISKLILLSNAEITN